MLTRGHRTNYGLFDPILTKSTFFNEMYYLFDFGQSTSSFRYSIRRIWLYESSDISEEATFFLNPVSYYLVLKALNFSSQALYLLLLDMFI